MLEAACRNALGVDCSRSGGAWRTHLQVVKASKLTRQRSYAIHFRSSGLLYLIPAHRWTIREDSYEASLIRMERKMGRVAIFVDADYIRGRAQTKRQLAGVPATQPIQIDEEALVDRLRQFGETVADARLLRIYWYDGMPRNGMSAEHVRLANIRDVKLRFGTLNNFGDQKGVDSRIIADVIELARNRAIDSAVLLGGDDDLRVAVEVAQSYGVRFHLLGIQDRRHGNQSELLQQEADTVTVWSRADTDDFINFPVAPESADVPSALASRTSLSASATIIDALSAKSISETVNKYVSTLDDRAKNDVQTVYDSRSAIAAPYEGHALARCRAALNRSLQPYEKSFMRKEIARALHLSKPSETDGFV